MLVCATGLEGFSGVYPPPASNQKENVLSFPPDEVFGLISFTITHLALVGVAAWLTVVSKNKAETALVWLYVAAIVASILQFWIGRFALRWFSAVGALGLAVGIWDGRYGMSWLLGVVFGGWCHWYFGPGRAWSAFWRAGGLAAKIIEGRFSPLERELEETYTRRLIGLYGSEEEAKRMVRDAIITRRQESKRSGIDPSVSNRGNTVLTASAKGDEKARSVVAEALSNGATEQDIKDWWDLPHLSRKMIYWSEQQLRYSVLSTLRNERGTDDAMAALRMVLPSYGKPNNEAHSQGDDRPLPDELRSRVEAFQTKHGADKIQRAVEKRYSSYNAFVRRRIQDGKL